MTFSCCVSKYCGNWCC